MASIILTLACVGLILYRIYKFLFTKPDNFPPGPPRLPYLGSYPFMLLLNYRHMHRAIDWLCKYYETDVLGLYAAHFPTVVANTAATVKELLNNPDLDGKPQLLLARLRDPEFTVRGNSSETSYPFLTKTDVFLFSRKEYFSRKAKHGTNNVDTC